MKLTLIPTFTCSPIPSEEIGIVMDHCRRLYKATKNVYFNSFFPRTITQWNSLPIDIVSLDLVDVFKSK